MDKKTVGLISLGCDKNRVDSERLLSALCDDYHVTNDISRTQILIINTCAFLESARKEAIQTVFEYLPYKEEGVLEKIIMTGCLPQKFIEELFDDLYEVDGFLGTFDGNLIKSLIDEVYKGKRVNWVKMGAPIERGRYLTTPGHYAYLKIADGCSNHCTYCLIPKIRGPFKSAPMEALVEEASLLGDVEELVLVAQDTTKYGLDLYGEPRLVELIKALSALENVKAIRLLYCYPELVSDALIEELATNPKLIKYIDIPFQHASDRILKLMNRKGTFASNLELVKKLKTRVKGIAIRSTFIAGFPGETEEDVKVLADFLKEAKLFNAGFFPYSKEPDTAASRLSGHMRAAEKNKRVKYLYSVQGGVMGQLLDGFVGQTLEVVCDGLDKKFSGFVGRAWFSAPEIDGVVYLRGEGLIEEGKKYSVRIKSHKNCDLYGVIENELT